MFSDVSYIVRFYMNGTYSDEVWHNTQEEAQEHLEMFGDVDGYSAIEIVRYDWIKREEKQIDVKTF